MVAPVRALRSSLGTQLDPNTSWMIMRSMETLALRMRASADNAGARGAVISRSIRRSRASTTSGT